MDEALVSNWDGCRVLVTGHTGFKGSWLSLWLHRLGAEVIGFSDRIPTTPSLFESARVAELVQHCQGDVADVEAVRRVVQQTNPDVVMHLAAQPLVRTSYADPVGTWRTNVLGTAVVLDAIASAGSVAATVVVTSDKCYEQPGPNRPFREGDPLGGHDPYSASKAAAELAAAAWRRSFPASSASMATARAGNVLGGGDWSDDRLVPDAVRASIAGAPLLVRNPSYLRPWQDVLDCLNGYLVLASQLLDGRSVAGAWNFAPPIASTCSVEGIVVGLAERWPGGLQWRTDDDAHPHEAAVLTLDATKAREVLGWQPRLDLGDTLDRLVAWYGVHLAGGDMRAVTFEQLDSFGPPGPGPG